MNYGKYFRLNLKESKIVDGIAVYDYIDLPAFFGRSSDNSISPKYPITVIISKDAVRFRLHYCAYRVEKTDSHGEKSIEYYFSSNDTLAHSCVESPTQIVHMQEVILELPFASGGIDSLSETISKIYATSFPQLTEFESEVKRDGFLNQLLEKRYRPEEWYRINMNSDEDGQRQRVSPEQSIEEKSYRALQKNIDGDRSYSSIWLMEIRKVQVIDNKESRIVDLTLSNEQSDVPAAQRKPKYVGFLRKLLLDFMFDLVHSDIFQSSANYTDMLSGLKADYMFSALLHKCEYYYCRGLVLDALNAIEKIPQKDQSTKKREVKRLYATQLLDAEKKWVEDIMNPVSDEVFQQPQEDFEDNWLGTPERKRAKQGSFFIYPYWFASPEEEMRRVCFSKSSNESKKVHLCNSETLAVYLRTKETPLENEKEKSLLEIAKEKLKLYFHGETSAVKQLRAKVSKWFFKRYDFNDAWRLHFFNGFALVEFFILLICILSLMFFPELVRQDFYFWSEEGKIGWIISLVIGSIWGALTLFAANCAFLFPRFRKWRSWMNKKNVLWPDRVTLAWKRVFYFLFITACSVGLIFLGASTCPPYLKLIGTAIWLGVLVAIGKKTNAISNIHVLYPRLYASITAAWLTLAIGNELFSAFFDSSPSILACAALGTIVLIFILYEINRHFPLISAGAKVWRSVQMLVYSYAISLLIGLFIINFTGREFLERSEHLPTFFEEYEEAVNPQSERISLFSTPTNDTTSLVSDNVSDTLRIAVMAKAHSVIVTEGLSDTLRIVVTAKAHKIDSTRLAPPRHHPQTVHQRHGYFRPKGVIPPSEKSNRKYFEQLENKKVPGKDHYIASIWRGANGIPIFFILRDFLIQFAFLAMFIGVFIQMIFEEKSITEM